MNIYEVVELSDHKSKRAVGWLYLSVSRECRQKSSDSDHWVLLIPGMTHSCFLSVPAFQERGINHFSIRNTLKILHLEGLVTALKISEAQKGCIWPKKREA